MPSTIYSIAYLPVENYFVWFLSAPKLSYRMTASAWSTKHLEKSIISETFRTFRKGYYYTLQSTN